MFFSSKNSLKIVQYQKSFWGRVIGISLWKASPYIAKKTFISRAQNSESFLQPPCFFSECSEWYMTELPYAFSSWFSHASSDKDHLIRIVLLLYITECTRPLLSWCNTDQPIPEYLLYQENSQQPNNSPQSAPSPWSYWFDNMAHGLSDQDTRME